jgi:thiopurine S-methyltransferase
MEPDFWLQRWQEGQTGFHQTRVTPLLAKYWPSLELPKNSKVLVPLCGKTLDMRWLVEQGHHVTGVELSSLAVEQFFQENQLRATVTESPLGTHYTAGNLTVICGDIFKLDAQFLSQFQGVYDRAALVALPSPMRATYVNHVYGQMAPGYKGLLITLAYDQSVIQGPPFSVNETEVLGLYSGHTRAKLIDQRDIIEKEPKFKERGLQHLDTLVFELSGARSS